MGIQKQERLFLVGRNQKELLGGIRFLLNSENLKDLSMWRW